CLSPRNIHLTSETFCRRSVGRLQHRCCATSKNEIRCRGNLCRRRRPALPVRKNWPRALRTKLSRLTGRRVLPPAFSRCRVRLILQPEQTWERLSSYNRYTVKWV